MSGAVGGALAANFPNRIVCLTEETTETLYLLGEQARIVGISGYTVRPPQARREKPRVAAFTSAKIDRILDLRPDLVIGFSDLQADIAAQLIRAGVAVTVFNQRSVDGILQMIRMLGAMVGAQQGADALVDGLRAGVEAVRTEADQYRTRPRIYFEEWHDPLFSAIAWVSELIQIAGGVDCFPELATQPAGRDRIISDPDEVIRRQPDIIIASWCGRRFRPEAVRSRPGWERIPAVRDAQLHEIKSPDILQPGPAALTDGLRQIADIVHAWQLSRLH